MAKNPDPFIVVVHTFGTLFSCFGTEKHQECDIAEII